MSALFCTHKRIYGFNKQYLQIRQNFCTDNLWRYKLKKCKIDSNFISQNPYFNLLKVSASSLPPPSPSLYTLPGSMQIITRNFSINSYGGIESTNQQLYNNYNNNNNNNNNINEKRYFSLSSSVYEHSSSKIEESVKKLQKEKINDVNDSTSTSTTTLNTSPTPSTPQKVVVKKTIKQKIWDEVLHYYHGFRLLFIDINVARKLLWKVLNGKTLTRREYRLLTRTTGDVFRLVPFSVFIIVPFMEFALPIFIKFFPGMLPSQFETAKAAEDKALNNLKVKLEMAKFLQKTLDEMAVQHKDHKSAEAKEFVEFFNKLRTIGERATPEEIMKFSKLFEDEITLDSLSRQQLTAICKVLEVGTLGTNNLLRFQLRMKLRSLAADDRMIQKEGIDSLLLSELQSACRARGMRSYGLSAQQLKDQLQEWINLSLDEKVPPTLLLLSRAMMLPEDVPTTEKLKATIAVLSDSAVTQTKAAIGEREGKIDNKTKIEIIRDEERKIKEEFDELKDVEKGIVDAVESKEILLDRAPIITDDALTSKDIDIVSDALEAVSKEKHTLLVEKEEIKELKEEIADYKEDREELEQVVAQSDLKVDIKESAAAKLLFKKVDGLISKLDKVLEELEKKEAKIQAHIQEIGAEDTQKPDELVKIDEMMTAIRKMQKVPDESKVDQIYKMLGKIDIDKDGQLKVDDVLKIVETIEKENVNLNEKQVDELIELLTKEEVLENEEKIEKAIAKSIVERQKEAKENSSGDISKDGHGVTDNETLKDTAITINESTEDEESKHILKSSDDTKKSSSASSTSSPSSSPAQLKKIEERINQTVIQNANEAAERQKDKILPLSPSGDVPKATQLPTNNTSKGNSTST